MRITVLLTLVSGCSFFTPSYAWHPSRQLTNDLECPPHLLPVLDTLVASAGSYAFYRTANRESIGLWPVPDRDSLLAEEILIAGPFLAGAIYGWVRSRQCQVELASLPP